MIGFTVRKRRRSCCQWRLSQRFQYSFPEDEATTARVRLDWVAAGLVSASVLAGTAISFFRG